jgi:hypothetical protein
MESSTGISNVDGNNAMKIFPNPATNEVTIEMDTNVTSQVSVSISDVQGKVLRTEKANVANRKLNLDVNALTDGIYFLKVGEGSASHYFKIAVER